VRTPARTISYFLSLAAIAAIFFSVEFFTEKYFYPNDEVVDILAAIIGALSFAPCKRIFDRVTDSVFSRGPRDAHAEFFLNVSHELQTPLAILRGNVELLQRRGITDAERAASERVIMSTLDGMSHLIGGVLEGAKARSSRVSLAEKYVSVGPLMQEAYEDCLLLAEDRGITLSADAEDNIFVRGDRGKLKEVLLNLVSNALKHTPRGGTIMLRAENAGTAAWIAVEDTGCGIAPEDLPHIFERFYRIHQPADSVPGTGLGLNICREIVEAHGGTISAESEFGKGSRFIVHIPLSVPSAPPGRGPAAATGVHAARDISAIINS